MVSRRDNHRHAWALAVKLHKLVGEGLLACGRWLLNVEHVAANEQRIGLVGSAPTGQLVEEMAVLVAPLIILVDYLSEVQVGGMQYSHIRVGFMLGRKPRAHPLAFANIAIKTHYPKKWYV